MRPGAPTGSTNADFREQEQIPAKNPGPASLRGNGLRMHHTLHSNDECSSIHVFCQNQSLLSSDPVSSYGWHFVSGGERVFPNSFPGSAWTAQNRQFDESFADPAFASAGGRFSPKGARFDSPGRVSPGLGTTTDFQSPKGARFRLQAIGRTSRWNLAPSGLGDVSAFVTQG